MPIFDDPGSRAGTLRAPSAGRTHRIATQADTLAMWSTGSARWISSSANPACPTAPTTGADLPEASSRTHERRP
ncbi:MAG: hypothetical protein R3323_00900, partial [Wenzhouxiangellaceae bacterium]|nr:hypothetical protein [Wenzhouxiangellaceae bacterium]